jgi:hypothetical protein
LGVAGPAMLVARECTAGTSILLIHSNNFVETGWVKFGVFAEKYRDYFNGIRLA